MKEHVNVVLYARIHGLCHPIRINDMPVLGQVN